MSRAHDPASGGRTPPPNESINIALLAEGGRREVPVATPTQKPTILVIGVGNPHRGDDAAGPLVASRLKQRAGDRFRVVEQAGEGLALLDAWEGADTVIILDAALSGAPAGVIHRIDTSAESLPKDFFRCSTHALGVTEAIELARVLCKLPRRVIVYGIEGESFAPGAGLTPAVEEAALKLEALVLKDVEAAEHAVAFAD